MTSAGNSPLILPKPLHVSACFILIKHTGSSYNTGATNNPFSKKIPAKPTLVY